MFFSQKNRVFLDYFFAEEGEECRTQKKMFRVLSLYVLIIEVKSKVQLRCFGARLNVTYCKSL